MRARALNQFKKRSTNTQANKHRQAKPPGRLKWVGGTPEGITIEFPLRCPQRFLRFRRLVGTQLATFSLRLTNDFCVLGAWWAFKKSYSRCVSQAICVFQALGGHSKIAFPLRFPSDFCMSAAWRGLKHRILAAFPKRFVHFRGLAGTQTSPSRCVSQARFAFQGPGGNSKIAFPLRFPSDLCISGAWRGLSHSRCVSQVVFAFQGPGGDANKSHSRSVSQAICAFQVLGGDSKITSSPRSQASFAFQLLGGESK